MCGIVGWAGAEPSPDLKERLRRAHAGQRHRGPDGDGWLEYAPAAGRVTLESESGARHTVAVNTRAAAAPVIIGHRRLAIIDLSAAGHQPMGTADGAHWIAFNGEIYNYRELRRELEGCGRSFSSQSDTEVLLHAFLEWGANAFDRLVGMFAFVVLDTVAGKLTLARDHFGQKPLYYLRHATGILFASEMRTLLRVAGTRPKARPSVVFDLLVRGATDHRPETMFDGIDAVPAGHWIELDLERPAIVRPRAYWSLQPGARTDARFEGAARDVRRRFLESIEMHLRSDVPVGTLLTGGVDSSSIVMATRRVAGESHHIQTFSYIGQDDARDEEPWIDSVTAAARATSHKLRLDPADWSRHIDDLTAAQDEPFGSLAIYAQHVLFRMAADAGVKVLLDGQGGDELLAGYRVTWTMRLATLLRRGRWFAAAGFMRRLAGARGPLDPRPWGVARQAVGTTLNLRRPQKVPAWVNTGWFRDRGVERPHPLLERQPRTVREAMVRSTLIGLPALLRWGDRNSMISSLEDRLPFLTPAFAETCLSLPDAYLVGPDGTNKYVFREAVRDLVPNDVFDRYEKIGFSVPHRAWLRRVPDLDSRLDAVHDLPCIDQAKMRRIRLLLRSNGPLDRVATFAVWRIIGFANWARVFDVAFP